MSMNCIFKKETNRQYQLVRVLFQLGIYLEFSKIPTVPKKTAMSSGEKKIWSTSSFFMTVLNALPGNCLSK